MTCEPSSTGEGIELWVARMKTRVVEVTQRVTSVREGHVFPTVRAAVAAFQARSATPADGAGERPSEGDAQTEG